MAASTATLVRAPFESGHNGSPPAAAGVEEAARNQLLLQPKSHCLRVLRQRNIYVLVAASRTFSSALMHLRRELARLRLPAACGHPG
jgi:hypothetical protein